MQAITNFQNESWINTWKASAPKDFTFSIKVNRSITDYLRLRGERALDLWNSFSKTLDSIRDRIDFWLFKMPRTFRYTDQNLGTLKAFLKMPEQLLNFEIHHDGTQ
ncbi:MAG TPA: DUF72 domain-containing protein [Nitrososphaeraceae archaeon]|nr:DUF72 domain-containing protein [Nitrososphaeraceae archaeon]